MPNTRKPAGSGKTGSQPQTTAKTHEEVTLAVHELEERIAPSGMGLLHKGGTN